VPGTSRPTGISSGGRLIQDLKTRIKGLQAFGDKLTKKARVDSRFAAAWIRRQKQNIQERSNWILRGGFLITHFGIIDRIKLS